MILLSAFALLAALSTPTGAPPPVFPSSVALHSPQASATVLSAQTARAPSQAILEIEKLRPDMPAEAQEFFLRKRLPEGETVLLIERYAQARERMLAMRQHSAATGSFLPSRAEVRSGAALPSNALGWTSLGPGNIGGRTLAMVIDPENANTMYAGTADGGIWKTTDAGASWVPVGDLLPSLAIGSLAMDPTNSSTLYAGTGEGVFNADAVQGAGVFRSLDAGDTWAQMPGTGTPDFYYVNSLAISRSTGTLYAATGTGVWRFNVRAKRWVHLLAPNTFLGCLSLALRNDPVGNDVLLAGCGSFLQGGVFRNQRAQTQGTSWEVVLTDPAMGRTSLAIAPSNPEVIYAVAASNAEGPNHFYNQGLLGVFRSTDGGSTWTAQVTNRSQDLQSTLLLSNPIFAVLQACGFGKSVPINQGWYNIIIAVDPINSDRVFVGGVDLFRSDDGGKTFGAASYWWGQPDPSYSHADQHALAFHPAYDGSANQTLFIASDGGIFRTDNALAQTAAGPVTRLCNDANSQLSYVSLNNGFAATQFYTGAVFPDGTLYLGGTQDNGTVLGSDALGPDAWATILPGLSGNGNGGVDPKATSTLFASNFGLSLQKSVDGGQSFASAVRGIVDNNFLFIAPLFIDPTNAKRLWTGGSYLWRTDDGAQHWSQATARIAGSHSAAISAFASSPVNPNYAIFGTSEGIIQYTTTALTSTVQKDTGHKMWPKAKKPRPGFVSSLTFHPSDTRVAYAAYATFGGTHVWKTTDSGATWTGIDGRGAGALPDVPVNSIVVDPTKPTNLYIGTDLGIFVSTDDGQNWAIELTGFPDSVADALVMHLDLAGGRSIYAFTHGRGVWRVNLP